jgi:hypothetical protein
LSGVSRAAQDDSSAPVGTCSVLRSEASDKPACVLFRACFLFRPSIVTD